MGRARPGLVSAVVVVVTLAAFLVQVEHRASTSADLWIVSFPAGYELSVQRGRDESLSVWLFSEHFERRLYGREGTRREPTPPRVPDSGTALV